MFKDYKFLFLSVLSGLFLGISYYYITPFLVWFSLTPVLFAIISIKSKRAFLYGYLTGLIQGLIMYFWIIRVTNEYSGTNSVFAGLLILIISLLYHSIYLGVFSFSFSFIRNRTNNICLLIALASLFWAGIEYFKTLIFRNAFPWFSYPLSLSLAKNVYLIQAAAFIGTIGISAFIIAVNILLAFALFLKKWIFLFISISIISLNLLYGFIQVHHFEKKQIQGRTIKLAILSENISAATRWNNETGDSLVNIFFNLNKQAVEKNPDIIIWSEASIPWTYTVNDPFMDEIKNITSGSKAWQIIGMLSEADDTDKIYNSAYLLNPQSEVVDRYDKVKLLNGLEKEFIPRFKNSKLSFMAGAVANNIVPGSDKIFNTDLGKIGVLICNESLLPDPSLRYIKENADFLVVMSNDSWFYNTQVPRHHFYLIRFRAIESRIPIVINSNMGISGIINPSGKIVLQEEEKSSIMDFSEIKITE